MPRIAALGRLALLTEDGLLAESSVRGRNLAVLALLARAGEAGLTREKIAAYLWPESDAGRARHSLDQALYTIRRTLGAEVLLTGATTLALDHRVMGSDVADFVRSLAAGNPRQAIEMYGGPFLDGFHLPGAPEFERWVDGERAALHGDFMAALETLARNASERGDGPAAITYWRRLAAAAPLSSRVALELMRALDRAGDRGKAIQSAQVHAALVRAELSAPPDPSVLEYADRLRGTPPADGIVTVSPGALPARIPAVEEIETTWSAPHQEAPPRPRLRLRLPRVGAGLVAGLVVLIALVAGRRSADPEEPRRVRVEAFQNETGDPAFDPLGHMAADWITEGLVRTGIVEVVAPGGSDASAHSLVEGRVYRRGDSVWIQARITGTADGVVLRALEPAGADASRPSEALEPLRQKVLGALGTLYDSRIAAWAGTALRPPSYAAYQEFAAGLELHAVPRDLPGAAERFRRAARLDPNYVLPGLWLAWASLMMEDYLGADSVVQALGPRRSDMSPLERAWHERIGALLAGDNERSYEAAYRMVEIAPGSGWAISLAGAALDTNQPEVAVSALLDAGIENLGLEREHGWSLLTIAYHMQGDHQRELAAAEAAIQSDGLDWGFSGPGVPALAALGRIDALEQRLEQLRALPPSPGTPRGHSALLSAVTELRAHGFDAEAERLASRMLAGAPQATAEGPLHAASKWARVQLLYELGRWGDAERLLVSIPVDTTGFRHLAMAGLLAARRGDRALALGAATQLAALDHPFLFGEPAFWRARISAVLGDTRTTVRLIRQALAEGQGGYAWHQLHVGRDFAPLHDDPQFRSLRENR